VEDLEIRDARPADAVALADLAETTFADTFGHLFAAVPDDLRAHLDRGFGLDATRAFLDRADVYVVVAGVAHTLVGYAKLVGSADDLQLERFYVSQAFIGRQIAAPLLAAAFARARAVGAASLRLSVYEENARAQRFYRKHGFSLDGTESYAIGSQDFTFHLMRAML